MLARLRAEKARAVADGKWKVAAERGMELAARHTEKGEFHAARAEYEEVAGMTSAGAHLQRRACRAICDLDVDDLERVTGDTLEVAERYLQLAKEARDRKEEQEALVTLGRVFLQVDPLRAAEYSRLAADSVARVPQDVAKGLERFEMRASALYNEALALKAAKEWKRMRKVLDELDAVVDLEDRVIPVKRFQFRSLAERSILDFQCRDMVKADLFSAKAMDASRDLGQEPAKAEVFQVRAKVLLALKRVRDAHRLLAEASRDLRKDPGVQNVSRGVRKVAKAAKRLEECPESDPSQRQEILETLGDYLSALGLNREAKLRYEESLQVAKGRNVDANKICGLYNSIGLCLEDDGHYEDAANYFGKDVALRIQQGQPEDAADAWFKVAACLKRSHAGYEKLEKELRKAIAFTQKHNLSESIAKLLRLLETAQREAGLDGEADLTMSDLEDVLRNLGWKLDDVGQYNEVLVPEPISSEDEDEEAAPVARPSRSPRGKKRFQVICNAKGETKLHLLCQIEGKEEEIRRLLTAGHPVNLRDKFNFTALHEAANFGHLNYVRLLVEAGADLNVLGGERGANITVLADACSNGMLDIVKYLTDSGKVDIFQQVRNERVNRT